MKKLLIILLAVLTITSCQKKETDPGVTQQDVSFAALNVTADAGLKSTNDFPNCPDEMGVPVSAEIIIDGVTYTPQVFELDGKWYTQSIKLEVVGDNPVTYQVTSFVLLDATGAIMAIPATGAAYSEYTDPDVPFDITVNKFAKAEVPVQVLCYQEADYDNFGFNWFEITQLVIREQCFFGDICLNGDPFTPADYELSTLYNYLQQPVGIQPDMPAIMKIIVKDMNGDEVPNSPFYNATADLGYGNGFPLCVQYPDNINVDGETFTFDLYILVQNNGGSYSYQWYHQFTATDAGALDTPVGDDGVLDFVLGNCNANETDLQLDWLPQIDNVVVQAGDLSTMDRFETQATDPSLWFFYDDLADVIDNSIGSFVTGPGTPPLGFGSAEISVIGAPRSNIATYQFSGVELADITTFAYSTYNPSAGNGGSADWSGAIQFNVSFDGTDTWQKRLVYIPSENGTVQQNTWQEWDVRAPDAKWRWSNTNTWPDQDGTIPAVREWSDILAAFPNIKIRVSDSWLGVRVGQPYTAGYTENIDAIKFGTGSSYISYDFEN